MDKKELRETLKDAEEYVTLLRNLNLELENAEKQITSTAEETEANINNAFTDLINYTTSILNCRKDRLLEETKKMKIHGIAPLKESRLLIAENLHKTLNLISLGKDIENNCDKINAEEFNDKTSIIGNLPAVPELKEVPSISFQFEQNIKDDLYSICNSYGSVFQIAPVQICSMSEKPGAILVEWQCIDTLDHITDIQVFRLQRAFGNVVFDKHLLANFKDCYIGNDVQFLVKEIQPNQKYSFRVCCKYEKGSTWSPWSVPQVSSTAIEPYRWKSNNKIILANENKIASPIESPSILISDGPQFAVGYSVEFTILECDNVPNNTHIGLVLLQQIAKEVQTIGELMAHSFLIDSSGHIYINGSKKSTKLPEFVKGSKLCFTYDKRAQTKNRVTVDACDKRVTYDWTILEEQDKLHFVASFSSTKWKILVE